MQYPSESIVYVTPYLSVNFLLKIAILCYRSLFLNPLIETLIFCNFPMKYIAPLVKLVVYPVFSTSVTNCAFVY